MTEFLSREDVPFLVDADVLSHPIVSARKSHPIGILSTGASVKAEKRTVDYLLTPL